MYPFLRVIKEFVKFRNAPALAPFETHVSQHICWPWDLDMFAELNNGRTLTIYDLGRLVLGRRAGLFAVLRKQGWGLTVAGSSIRYRRRVTMFDRFEMRSRLIGWDSRFLYLEQSMWRGDICLSHVLIRSAIVDANGIVTTDRFLNAYGETLEAPQLPEWVQSWIASEDLRPWPPMQDDTSQRLPTAA